MKDYGEVKASVVDGEITFIAEDKKNNMLVSMLTDLWAKRYQDGYNNGFNKGKDAVYREIGENVAKRVNIDI